MKFYVIGLDDRRKPSLEPEVCTLIAAHRVFSGGKRHRELIGDYLPERHEWLDITVPLEEVLKRYTDYEEVVVFASGDPLFYGFANTLRKYFPEAEMQVYPWFNSLQLLAHRLLMPYHDMRVVSLTGRPWHEFDRALICGEVKIGILTDRKHTPAAIAGQMLEYGYDNYRMSVGEKLGNDDERVRMLTLPEAASSVFSFPNCLILERIRRRPHFFGIPEEEFHLLDGRTRMITKMPVRLLTLSMLDLSDRCYFWDIGFCTGSVSIEAKLQFPHLHITAFEQRKEGAELMALNSRKFGTPGIGTVIGDFTEADLSAYESPEAVFIGGYGGKMEAVVAKAEEKLVPGGVVVFNSVSRESGEMFEELTEKYGLKLVRRERLVVNGYNPIEVMKAVKEER